MVKKAEYNRETKTAEAKVVANAARNKRNELTDLERMLARCQLTYDLAFHFQDQSIFCYPQQVLVHAIQSWPTDG